MTHLGQPHSWKDESAMWDYVARHSFAQITCVADGRPLAAHAPISVSGRSVQFHLARINPIVIHLDGATALVTIVGAHGYVSPDWYGTPDQVPTWNYTLVEIEGVTRRLDEAELRAQADALSAAQEALLAPKPPWTSDKMDARKHRLMLRAIVGFAIDRPMLRGARKLGQNKSAAEAAGAIARLRARGDHALAAAMAATRP